MEYLKYTITLKLFLNGFWTIHPTFTNLKTSLSISMGTAIWLVTFSWSQFLRLSSSDGAVECVWDFTWMDRHQLYVQEQKEALKTAFAQPKKSLGRVLKGLSDVTTSWNCLLSPTKNAETPMLSNEWGYWPCTAPPQVPPGALLETTGSVLVNCNVSYD